MQGLKYPPIKSTAKQLPRVLFYKATGCKNAKCARGADGVYRAVDTRTGKLLGSIDVSSSSVDTVTCGYYDLDKERMSEVLHRSGYFNINN